MSVSSAHVPAGLSLCCRRSFSYTSWVMCITAFLISRHQQRAAQFYRSQLRKQWGGWGSQKNTWRKSKEGWGERQPVTLSIRKADVLLLRNWRARERNSEKPQDSARLGRGQDWVGETLGFSHTVSQGFHCCEKTQQTKTKLGENSTTWREKGSTV